MSGRHAHRALLALPTLLMLGGVPWAGTSRADVFGLPLLLVWILGGVLLTPPVVLLVHALDRRAASRGHGSGDGEAR